MRRFLAALLAVTVGILSAGGISARAADTHPADYPTVQALEHMSKLIAERSGGRQIVTDPRLAALVRRIHNTN